MSRFFNKSAAYSSDSDESSSSEEDIKLQQKEEKRSKFMKGASSDEESDSESEEEDVDDDDSSSSDQEMVPSGGKQAAKFIKGAVSDSDSDDSEDDGKAKVVKSARDKRFEEMRSYVKALNNGKKIGDWTVIQKGNSTRTKVPFIILCDVHLNSLLFWRLEFEKLTKSYGKAAGKFHQEKVPRFFVRTLAHLEDLVKQSGDNKDAKKKMNALNAKALNAMKQNLKKYNKSFETDIEKFREVK